MGVTSVNRIGAVASSSNPSFEYFGTVGFLDGNYR